MNTFFHRPAVLGLSLTLLAGCNAGNPNPPVYNAAMSTPNLQFSLNAGQTTTGYVFFNDASSESIAGNIDQLAGATIDPSGKTGLLSLAPPANQMPGIYYLTIDAINTNGTVSNLVVANITPPGQPGAPTVVDFPMHGYSTERAVVTLFDGRNEISGGLTLQLLTPAKASPSPGGVNVNNIYATLNSGTNSYAISADLTVSLANLQTNTVTASDGKTYSNGMSLVFTALPVTSNGYTYTPYSETIYLHPI